MRVHSVLPAFVTDDVEKVVYRNITVDGEGYNN